jgi:hypothetical protein
MSITQRWITWGAAVAAFVVTLGLSAWHEGLWGADGPRESAPLPVVSLTNPAQMQGRPFGPSRAALELAAPTPQATPLAAAAAAPTAPELQPEAAPEVSNSEPQAEPYNTPDVDNGEMQALRDRAALHSSRSH